MEMFPCGWLVYGFGTVWSDAHRAVETLNVLYVAGASRQDV